MANRKIIDPTEWTARMLSGARNNGDRWVSGVAASGDSFKTNALAAREKYKARMQESLGKDRWAKGMAKVDVNQAIATAVALGPSAVADGMDARRDKIQGKIARLAPLVQAHSDKINAMPTTTQADVEKKMLENMRGMQAIGDKLRE